MRQPQEWRSRVSYGPGMALQTGKILRAMEASRALIVCGASSFHASGADQMIGGIQDHIEFTVWDDFEANTSFDDLCTGLQVMHECEPDVIVGVGGGSAMDMAKLLAAYADGSGDVADRICSGDSISETDHRLVLVPTTSGSGSEATHFAVVYIGDTKFSVAGDGLYADEIVLDPELVVSGSPYQRATSGIDAVCQAIESLWATAATTTSQRYARRALGLLLPTIRRFVSTGDAESAARMSIGSHLSGRAIDISKTTGAHALSYFVTKRFGISHGNAVALTLGAFMDLHLRPGALKVEVLNLPDIMNGLSHYFRVASPDLLSNAFEELLEDLDLFTTLDGSQLPVTEITEEWIDTVNLQRLANNPVKLDRDSMRELVLKSW